MIADEFILLNDEFNLKSRYCRSLPISINVVSNNARFGANGVVMIMDNHTGGGRCDPGKHTRSPAKIEAPALIGRSMALDWWTGAMDGSTAE